MKKVIALILSLIFAMQMIASASASALESLELPTQIQSGTIIPDIKLQKTIDEYFKLRNNVLSSGTRATSTELASAFSELSVNQTLNSNELARMSAVDNLAAYHNVYLINSSNEISIQNIAEISDSVYELDIYEWTWIEYNDGNSDIVDVMGYSTDHKMTVRKGANNSYQITNNIYDESEILGVPSNHELLQTLSTVVINEPKSLTGVNSAVALNVEALVKYADTWVVHQYASTMQNPSNYNTSVYGYYVADCANYTSQCLRAGGMQYDYGSGKDNENWDGTQWWFDTYPNPNYENYNVSPPSWRKVSQFIPYWEGQGYARVAATGTSVFPGNPVINDTSHVGICVGYNSAGTPIINAHNRDVYHVPYTMIGTGTRTTIQIVTYDAYGFNPGYFENLGTISAPKTLSTEIEPNYSQWFKFTVPTSGSYEIYSSTHGENYDIDLSAVLYRQSETSNGVTLYMTEVGSNDNGGQNNHFALTKTLSAGTYYIRVKSKSSSDYGFYKVNVEPV